MNIKDILAVAVWGIYLFACMLIMLVAIYQGPRVAIGAGSVLIVGGRLLAELVDWETPDDWKDPDNWR